MTKINPYIFREYDIRGEVEKDLTDETVELLGKGIGTYLQQNGIDQAVVGYDARLSSVPFSKALIRGLTSTGVDVVDIGLVATPVLYFSLYHFDISGGVMITGSHNPPQFNGFKVCANKTAIFGEEIRKIRDIIDAGNFKTGEGKVVQRDAIGPYQNYLIGNADLGDRKLKIILDGGNGSAAFIAEKIYKRLGMDVECLFCEPDGRFPNHHPDPTVLENMQDIIRAVKEKGADVGIAFDGDGDRIGVVDEKGEIIMGDRLLLIFAKDILKTNPDAEIIAEVKCSKVLFDEVKKAGGRTLMWRVGHSLIKAKMAEDGALLGGEMSGHIFFKHRYFGFDDATYAGLRLIEILSKTNKPVSALLKGVPKPASTPEIRVPCPDEKKFAVVKKAVEYYKKQGYEVIDIDGARVHFPDGWGLIRASNTQPVLVFRFEADNEEALKRISEDMQAIAERFMKEV